MDVIQALCRDAMYQEWRIAQPRRQCWPPVLAIFSFRFTIYGLHDQIFSFSVSCCSWGVFMLGRQGGWQGGRSEKGHDADLNIKHQTRPTLTPPVQPHPTGGYRTDFASRVYNVLNYPARKVSLPHLMCAVMDTLQHYRQPCRAEISYKVSQVRLELECSHRPCRDTSSCRPHPAMAVGRRGRYPCPDHADACSTNTGWRYGLRHERVS